MLPDNDNKPPEWDLIAHMHFLSLEYAELTQVIAGLPYEHKQRFAGVIGKITDRLELIHDALDALCTPQS